MSPRRALLLCGVFAPPLFFLALLLFGWMTPGYDLARQFISELGAVDSPVRVLVNVFGFGLFGVFLVLFSVGVVRSSVLRTTGKLSALFFFAAGVSMILVGVFSCDANCINTTVTGDLHNKFSFYPFPILTVAFLLLLVDATRIKNLRWLVPFIPLLGIPALIFRFASLPLLREMYPGLLQRAAIGLPFFLVMLIAMGVYRTEEPGDARIPKSAKFFYTTALALIVLSVAGLMFSLFASSRAPYDGVPGICADTTECRTICQNNRGRCQSYCARNEEAPVCTVLGF
ncbi:MAG: hypothetical protein A3J08_03515 [Candidatus Lloydbacteria bacterium RIFCSPLOWO2_02_FULL_51_11]|uniref:DUF998 domain-containing protein n=1 Tax=Candidatus Lloydbacteria bacterium RIFCSPLOWO2_02_FULL_51_11 TaxID=1798667 RepID=A0A1G2DSI2_9BACT|nr:MAG: hypothetical protein A3J08_03515 [Candidatus Lloydbacteria bacterium RIFCSPLOWO2_02_FULL_51_11]